MREELASIKENLDQQMQDGTFVAMKKVEYATSFGKQVLLCVWCGRAAMSLLCCLPFCTFGGNDDICCNVNFCCVLLFFVGEGGRMFYFCYLAFCILSFVKKMSWV